MSSNGLVLSSAHFFNCIEARRGDEILSFLICRDSLMEILFEQDNEEKSVASLILDALVKVQEKSHGAFHHIVPARLHSVWSPSCYSSVPL